MQRSLQLALVLSVVIYALGRSYEAALYLSGEMLQATDACSDSSCTLALQFHLWAGYLCGPLAIAALAFHARSPRAFLLSSGLFLLLMLASDLAALAALWGYYAFSFSGPYRDDLLILRLFVPVLGAVLAVVLWSKREPTRRAV